MDLTKYNTSIMLLCPTCGGSHFESDADTDEPTQVIRCASCERQMTKSELIEANGETVSAHINEIGTKVRDEIAKDIKDRLRKALAGNKYITLK